MTPRVSVIVPVYNVEKYLRRCLVSLVSQSLRDIEIIVVNDGSPDRSQRIIDEFAAAHPDRVRALVKENGGLSDARNFGLSHARGEYVGFVDGDDYVVDEMYEEMYERAAETDADIVVCGYSSVDAATGERLYRRQGWKKYFGKPLEDEPRYLRWVAPYAWNKIFRRSLFETTGVRFPLGRLFEDIPVTYSLLLVANKIEKVQRSLYRYVRGREGAITHSYSARNMEMFASLTLLNDFYRENGAFDRFREELLLVNFRHAFNRFVELPHYSGIGTKQQLVKEAVQHLDQNFPRWRSEPSVRERHGLEWRFRFFVSPVAARLYAAAPRALHLAADSASKAVERVREFAQRFGADRRLLLRYTRYLRRLPVDPSIALFESFHGKKLVDSPFYLMRDLAGRGTHKLFVTAVDRQEALAVLARYGIEATPVDPGSPEYLRLLATSGLLVNNTSFPSYFVKRPEQVYLNTWHGTPLKTLGKSMPYGLRDLPNLQRNFLKADFLLFTNEFTREHMVRDYMLDICPVETLLMGSPRNAALFDADRASCVRAELGLGGKRVLVYMPTWRGSNSRQAEGTSFAEEVGDYLSALDASLGEDDVLLVKLHTLVGADLDFSDYAHVRPTPADYETYELLNVADVLITDYSSVFFDFAATGREVLLFAYDRDEYLAERNFYMDYDELPFPVFTSVESLAKHLCTRMPFSAGPEYKAFAQRFAGLDGPDAPRLVNDALLERIAADDRRAGPEVDLVFLPYLGKHGQELLERLVSEGYDRPDAVLVFSIKRHLQRANAYLYHRFSIDGIQLRYIVTTDRTLVTARQSFALWLHRRTGWFSKTVDEVNLLEARRLFGNLNIRSVRDESGYRKYGELSETIKRSIVETGSGQEIRE